MLLQSTLGKNKNKSHKLINLVAGSGTRHEINSYGKL